jgi:hypothetical protein
LLFHARKGKVIVPTSLQDQVKYARASRRNILTFKSLAVEPERYIGHLYAGAFIITLNYELTARSRLKAVALTGPLDHVRRGIRE